MHESEEGEHYYRLDESEADAVWIASIDLAGIDARTDVERFCEEAIRRSASISSRMRSAVSHFKRHGNSKGVLILSGLRVGAIPSTPSVNDAQVASTTMLCRQQAVVCSLLGDLIGYEAESSGGLFQDVVPTRRGVRRQVSSGSGVELEAHTEQAHSPWRPDYVALGCLRGDPRAETFVFSARSLINHLTRKELMLAFAPMWKTFVDESFRKCGRKFALGDSRGPMSILYGLEEDPFMVVDQDLMCGIDKAASELLAKIVGIFQRDRHSHVIRPGEIVIIDNRRTMHGRSNFQPQFDGGDRFLARSFIIRDLDRCREALLPGSRVIAAELS